MITIVVAGIAFIVVVAVVVGIMDAVQARVWREIAAERRDNWEARQLQANGSRGGGPWED